MIKIRKILPSDCLQLSLLDNTLFKSNISEKVYAEMINSNSFLAYGLFDGDLLISFITFLLSYPDYVDIINFGTHPDFRKQGYGNKLLDYAINYIKKIGFRKINLEVRVSNEPAIKLYTKLNFLEIQKRLNYYNDNEDAIMMQLLLQKEEKK